MLDDEREQRVMEIGFAGKTVVVSGAGIGFGRVIAENFAALGANVHGCDILEAGLADTAKAGVKTAVVDLTDRKAAQGWIRQVMFNLFSNAMRHSPPSGTITCSSRCANNHWTVEIQDEGPGVPPERLEEIFERFVQITPRSGPGAGAGLGLAICKSIIELHKGKISARLRTNRSGLIVGFSLPINELATTP